MKRLFAIFVIALSIGTIGLSAVGCGKKHVLVGKWVLSDELYYEGVTEEQAKEYNVDYTIDDDSTKMLTFYQNKSGLYTTKTNSSVSSVDFTWKEKDGNVTIALSGMIPVYLEFILKDGQLLYCVDTESAIVIDGVKLYYKIYRIYKKS